MRLWGLLVVGRLVGSFFGFFPSLFFLLFLFFCFLGSIDEGSFSVLGFDLRNFPIT